MTTKNLEAEVKAAEARELEKEIRGDVVPGETAREKLERLERESAEALAAAKAEVKADEERARSEFIEKDLIPAINDVVAEAEKRTGLTMRSLVVRYQKPGDETPELWDEVDEDGKRVPIPAGTAGIVVLHKLVRARQKDA